LPTAIPEVPLLHRRPKTNAAAGFSPTHRPFPAGPPTLPKKCRRAVLLFFPVQTFRFGLGHQPDPKASWFAPARQPEPHSHHKDESLRGDDLSTFQVFGPLWRIRSVRVHTRGIPAPLSSAPAVFHDFDGFLHDRPSGIFQPVTPMGLPPSRAFTRFDGPRTTSLAAVYPLHTRAALFRVPAAGPPLS
jgi:hypothetical protein